MSLSLRNLDRVIRRYLSREWSKLDFEFEMNDKRVKATAEITLQNHDDDIMIIYSVNTGGMGFFSAVFDKIEATSTVLRLLNEFNDDELFFCIYIREDGFLEVRHATAIYDEDMAGDYFGECLSRFSKLADNSILQQLTRLTHD